MKPFQAVRVSERVYWVGAVDWRVRDFHGYSTSRGSTYNAFLVEADRLTLVDTVKAPFLDEMMQRISSVCDPSKIDVIVSNHSEMDHTGALPDTVEMVKPSEVYASKMGVDALAAHFHWDREVKAVSSGDRLDLGGAVLHFIETRMLHWPDSMVAYLPEDRLLFSQDGFGMHLASTERFDDLLPMALLEEEARKYYANILMPFSGLVEKLVRDIAGMELEIDVLCPDHGPVWRKNVQWIIDKWNTWASKPKIPRGLVIYDTMWGSTGKMARAVAEGMLHKGVESKVFPLRATHISDVASELLEASALVVGSPTLNGRIFPSVAECLNYLGGLKPKGLVGAAFGSYGWSGESVKELNGILEKMKVHLVSGGFSVKYVPKDDDLEKCFELGAAVAGELLRESG